MPGLPRSTVFGRAGCLPCAKDRSGAGRRSVILTIIGTLAAPTLPVQAGDVAEIPDTISEFADNISKLQKTAMDAYERRDFKKAVDTLSEILYQQPNNPYWSELRAQVLIDGRNFSAAVMDYNQAMQQTDQSENEAIARLTQGRGLALEGDGDFENALKDYKTAQELAEKADLPYDPYTTHSIGNCYAALGDWQKARNYYTLAARAFEAKPKDATLEQQAAARLDGSIFAKPNAAVALLQLQDVGGAEKELEDITAKGGEAAVDAYAALTGIYHSDGRDKLADKAWSRVCKTLTDRGGGDNQDDGSLAGCKYKHKGWLSNTRKWPITAIDLLGKYIDLQE